MERELFRDVRRWLRVIGQRRRSRKFTYTDACIVAVYAWAVINDRPVSWACCKNNWPPGLRRGPLPSQSVASRRLRTRSVLATLNRLEREALGPARLEALVLIADGKPLPIAAHTQDRQAGYGRAAGGLAKGYKLHAVITCTGVMRAWRVAPMNKDERVMTRRIVREIEQEGYLLGDRQFDDNNLFAIAAESGLQMVVPRRYGPDKKLGHRKYHPARLRSKDILEGPTPAFGLDLFKVRRRIEAYFGTLCSGAGGLGHLPSWVRTHRRVHAWVQMKIILDSLRRARRHVA